MVDVEQIASAVGAGVQTGVLYLVLIGMCGILAFGIAHWKRFFLTCKYRDLVADGRGGFTNGKERQTRFAWSDKSKTSLVNWKEQFGFSKRLHKPFDNHYICEGNTVYANRLPDGTFIPVEWRVKQNDVGKIEASLNSVAHHLRAWQALEHQKNAVEFKDQKREQQAMYMFIAAIIGSVVILGLSMYFVYKFGSPDLATINANTGAINNLASALTGKLSATGGGAVPPA